ncbi:hypothetical protein JTB14_003106 [Gonioctena quinquepunctata]|nr:hypothetical protein JTB14_003106 [Gonioctena quinquepunctata]
MFNFNFIECVPPSPTSAITDLLQAEFSTVKNTIKVLSDQWEKWNTLFIISLEPRITSMSSTLASMDSNIHNLQERAHVWDTFQLHLSAWNEQLASLDRKMDIMNKGQENVISIENKMNAIQTLEYKLDNVLKTLSQVHNSIFNLETITQSKSYQISHDSLLNEFTSRGVLSSIKMVEKKLDRLLLANQNVILKSKGADKSKLQIKCNTPRLVEDSLNDISSKVDVMFDTLTKNKANVEDFDYENEYLELSEGSGDNIDSKNQQNSKRLKKAIRNACNQMNPVLEELLNRTIRIQNTTLVILDSENTHYEKITSRKSCSKILKAIEDNSVDLNNILGSYFSEQRAHFESIVRRAGRSWLDHRPTPPTVPVVLPQTTSTASPLTTTQDLTEHLHFTDTMTESTTLNLKIITNVTESDYIELEPSWKPKVNQNISSCADLNKDETSGVFIFENHLEGINEKLFFNKRFCEIRNDGLWTVIQRRDNYNTQHNFNVSWEDYKYGFGNLNQDFWIGNEFLHNISREFNLVLRIELGDFENNMAWAEYDTFSVASEENKYMLTVGNYSGNASDSFSSHNGSYFSTFDRTNDQAPECCPCAVSYGGGWWFNSCFESNLNGIYHRKPDENSYFRGIIWEHWLENYSLKRTVMMVKPRGTTFSDSVATPKVEDIPFYEDP